MAWLTLEESSPAPQRVRVRVVSAWTLISGLLLVYAVVQLGAGRVLEGIAWPSFVFSALFAAVSTLIGRMGALLKLDGLSYDDLDRLELVVRRRTIELWRLVLWQIFAIGALLVAKLFPGDDAWGATLTFCAAAAFSAALAFFVFLPAWYMEALGFEFTVARRRKLEQERDEALEKLRKNSSGEFAPPPPDFSVSPSEKG